MASITQPGVSIDKSSSTILVQKIVGAQSAFNFKRNRVEDSQKIATDLTGWNITAVIEELDIEAGAPIPLPDGVAVVENGERWVLADGYAEITDAVNGEFRIVIPAGLGMKSLEDESVRESPPKLDNLAQANKPKWFQFGIVLENGESGADHYSTEFRGLIKLLYSVVYQ